MLSPQVQHELALGRIRFLNPLTAPTWWKQSTPPNRRFRNKAPGLAQEQTVSRGDKASDYKKGGRRFVSAGAGVCPTTGSVSKGPISGRTAVNNWWCVCVKLAGAMHSIKLFRSSGLRKMSPGCAGARRHQEPSTPQPVRRDRAPTTGRRTFITDFPSRTCDEKVRLSQAWFNWPGATVTMRHYPHPGVRVGVCVCKTRGRNAIHLPPARHPLLNQALRLTSPVRPRSCRRTPRTWAGFP
jgi:hypothetical protein